MKLNYKGTGEGKELGFESASWIESELGLGDAYVMISKMNGSGRCKKAGRYSASTYNTRGTVEKGELKPGGARAVPEDARGACWVQVGRRRWMANALVQARPNCWRKWILGVGAV
eukprot:scaffold5101_cov224-Skeletonema_dohrnii-CCMP3373.AAC.2